MIFVKGQQVILTTVYHLNPDQHCPAVVERVTPSGIAYVNGTAFAPDGRERGSKGRRVYHRIRAATDEDIAAVRQRNALSVAATNLRRRVQNMDQAAFTRLGIERIAQIEELLKIEEA